MPSVAATRVAFGDQPLRRGDEVLEDPRLAGEHAGAVPRLAELAAAAQDGQRVDAAGLDPRRRERAERRPLAGIEAAVAEEQRRRRAGAGQAALVRDEHRHPRSVLRGRRAAGGPPRRCRPTGSPGRARACARRRQIEPPRCFRRGKRLHRQHRLPLAVAANRRPMEGRHLDLPEQRALRVEAGQARGRVVQEAGVGRAVDHREVFEHVGLLGQDHAPALARRLRRDPRRRRGCWRLEIGAHPQVRQRRTAGRTAPRRR